MNKKTIIGLIIGFVCLVITIVITVLWQHDSAFLFIGFGIVIVGVSLLFEFNKYRKNKE